MSEKLEFVIKARDKFSGVFGKLKSALPSLKTLAIGTSAAVVGLGASLFAMAKTTATSYDKIQKLSDQLGVSTEFLSKMGVAAEFSGVKSETARKSIQMLTIQIGQMAQGIGLGKDAFDGLGLSVKNADGTLKTAEQLMPELAGKFGKMTDATQKAQYAYELFGARGMEMLQMFKGGKKGLQDMWKEAEKFGLVVSKQAGANAAAFNDSITRLTGSFKGLKNTMAEKLMPTITGLSNKFANFIANNRGKIIEFGVKFIKVMGALAEKGAYAVAVLVDSWRGLRMIWEIIKIAFSEMNKVLWQGLDFLIKKIKRFMEAVNFRGMFDGAIEKLNEFTKTTKGSIDYMNKISTDAKANLAKLASEGLATSKVKAFADKFKKTIAELRAAGTVKIDITTETKTKGLSTGIPLTKKLKAALAQVNDMWDKQFLTQEEKLGAWYKKELSMVGGKFEAILKLTDIYNAKKEALREAATQKVKDMWDDQFQTQEEKLNDWHDKELASIGNNLEAKLKLEEIYEKKKEKIKADAAKKEKIMRDANFNAARKGLDNFSIAFRNAGRTGFAVSKGLAIASATMTTYDNAVRMFKVGTQFPFPANVVMPFILAASAVAAGVAQISRIKSTSYSPKAHTGLTEVPREEEYLLQKGERVLSPNQNKDLKEFIQTQNSVNDSPTIINVDVLPNATNLDALLSLSRYDWTTIVEDKIIPGLRILATRGVTA